ncbi:hypothetical protein ACLEIY_04925 [Acetobacter tropicalis]|uniref:hypothetical protein n=1 Tax=Acetobacter tropicalis TaxID=104102 RepID=UPI0039752948
MILQHPDLTQWDTAAVRSDEFLIEQLRRICPRLAVRTHNQFNRANKEEDVCVTWIQ